VCMWMCMCGRLVRENEEDCASNASTASSVFCGPQLKSACCARKTLPSSRRSRLSFALYPRLFLPSLLSFIWKALCLSIYLYLSISCCLIFPVNISKNAASLCTWTCCVVFRVCVCVCACVCVCSKNAAYLCTSYWLVQRTTRLWMRTRIAKALGGPFWARALAIKCV
jgi:hypothetical protein